VPSLEDIGLASIADLWFVRPRDGSFTTADVIMRLLEAHMLTRLLERARPSWHGGITPRIVLYMVAADMWAKNIEFKTILGSPGTQAHLQIKNQQLDGLIKFAREMSWPFAYEIVEAASKLRPKQPFPKGLPMPFWDWLNGVVLPGHTFPSVIVIALYAMSNMLRPHSRNFALRTHRANFGILYPNTSYWNMRSIFGKVLAPMSLVGARRIKCLAGWVGPCPTTNSFTVANVGLALEVQFLPPPLYTAVTERDEYARRAVAPTHKPSDKTAWIEPKVPEKSTESVSLQTLLVREGRPGGAGGGPYRVTHVDCYFLFDGGRQVTFRLLYNSVFLSAPPCRGIHRIDPRHATNYSFRTLKLLDLSHPDRYVLRNGEAISLINATSGGAAETYARAWCSWVGSNAVIWEKDAGKSCFKCALMTAGSEGLAIKTLIIC
jgi:hypothetical protein